MNTFRIVLGLASFLIFLNVSHAESINEVSRKHSRNDQDPKGWERQNKKPTISTTTDQDCIIRIDDDLPEPQPLLLIPGGTKDGKGFFLPQGAAGTVTVANRKEVLLACPGAGNGFRNTAVGGRTSKAACNGGTKFSVNSVSYDISDFACKQKPVHVAKASGSKCYDGTKRHIGIGFEVGSDFYKIIDICFDNTLYASLYAKSTVVSGIKGSQVTPARPNFVNNKFYPRKLSVTTLYTKTKQQQTLSTLLGSLTQSKKYVPDTSDFYLERGHYSPKADFVYGAQQYATFFYVNAAPQWHTINDGNWKVLEISVRTYADKNKVNLDVYTGTYGNLTLPNVNGIETELYLYVDRNNNKAIPVPKLFWKAVYNPTTLAGTVFVGINNPYVIKPQGDYIICADVCSKISWLRWDRKNIRQGYSYCCDVEDFRSTVKTLPEFTVTGLLM